MRIDNAMLWTEQKANAKRRLIYTVCLTLAVILSLCASHVVASMVWYANGVADGRDIEKRVQANTPTKAPANCTEWLRSCADEQLNRVDRIKKAWRKPT